MTDCHALCAQTAQALLLVASGPPCRLLMVCWRGPSGSSALSSMVSMSCHACRLSVACSCATRKHRKAAARRMLRGDPCSVHTCAGAASFALSAAQGTLTIAEQAATAVLRGTQWLTRETALGALNAAQAVANAVLTGIGEPSQDGPDGFANTPPVGSRCILRSCASCLLQPTITFWASCHQPQSPPCCRAAVLQSGPR